ncbi:hypothetical protein [Virgibacillus pantothenticus]|uniref:Uncharacterized protein n=1 Tax=Virgibacillus pantothenticus TaxID=1473 RepID=A0A0L0QKM1_VIRPA|nr:hypothetical protein [Virgibacillus pantothenticus]KNE18823.1 hypothetical protein AFK71_09515 [Virgibacillus pantothenticus]MED3738504.1 hypothetical protein [Virgibacillus pantothenticus]QTY15250.1 hypothetical protein KBP50_15260 [Virgibacillus pantothenticus]SIS83784.1 hypothetical protein SAMN05421787_104249 [Virgibacillus pantothenticus]
MVKSKNFLLKSGLVFLSVLLFFTSIPPVSASSVNSSDVTVKNAVEILEALDNSAVTQTDSSILINEDQLEKELKDNQEYEKVKVELEKAGLLTNKTYADIPIMRAASSALNPKWVKARNSCAKKYLKDKYGVAALSTTIAALFSGSFRKAAKELAKTGAKLTVPGLIAAFGVMNYKCIKEANSKHSVY